MKKVRRVPKPLTRLWKVKREWAGEDVFILAGGPSVLQQDLSLLTGRRVIAINSAYEAKPDSDILFFADLRWWKHNRRLVEKAFKGRVATVSSHAQGDLLRLRRCVPIDPKTKEVTALSTRPFEVVMQRTSLHGAINLAVHLGAKRIVLLGADLGPDKTGRTEHHRPHPWKRRPNTWRVKLEQLVYLGPALDKLGVQVVNVSGISSINWWPQVKRLEDAL